MNIYYLDTSALLKRYVNETGSVWLRALIDPALDSVPIIAQLAVVEVTSAFNRRVREGTFTATDYSRVETAFRGDCLTQYQLVSLNEAVVDLACRLVERHPRRTSTHCS